MTPPFILSKLLRNTNNVYGSKPRQIERQSALSFKCTAIGLQTCSNKQVFKISSAHGAVYKEAICYLSRLQRWKLQITFLIQFMHRLNHGSNALQTAYISQRTPRRSHSLTFRAESDWLQVSSTIACSVQLTSKTSAYQLVVFDSIFRLLFIWLLWSLKQL